MVTNFELKQKARSALKDNWQIALMVALIASLPSLISQVVSVMTTSGMTQTMQNLMGILQDGSTIDDLLALMAEAELSVVGYIPSAVVSLVSWLVSPFLTLGMLNYFFMLLRGEQDVPVSAVFSRKGCFFKGIGLNLMTALRTFLWMLPGAVLEVASMFLALSEGTATIGLVLMLAGSAAMLVLGIRAALHYAMATRVLAECPEKGINQCIRESVAIMRNRKMLLVSLELSFILLSLLISLAESLLTGLLGTVLGATLSMALSFALNIYMQMAASAFYVAYRAQTEI